MVRQPLAPWFSEPETEKMLPMLLGGDEESRRNARRLSFDETRQNQGPLHLVQGLELARAKEKRSLFAEMKESQNPSLPHLVQDREKCLENGRRLSFAGTKGMSQDLLHVLRHLESNPVKERRSLFAVQSPDLHPRGYDPEKSLANERRSSFEEMRGPALVGQNIDKETSRRKEKKSLFAEMSAILMLLLVVLRLPLFVTTGNGKRS